MAVTRRGFVFGAFLLGAASVLLIVVALAGDYWVSGAAHAEGQVGENRVHYGLFRGTLLLRTLATPTANTLYMTCVSSAGACALTCKTEEAARVAEVVAMASGLRTNAACVAVTEVSADSPMPVPPVVSLGGYACAVALVAGAGAAALAATALALLNATRNPTESVLGLPGCLWSNVAAATLGVAALAAWGALWAGGLRNHLALSYTAQGELLPDAALGYSYWLVLVAVLLNASSAALLVARAVLLERQPPPPVIKLDNHSDGMIFLY